MGKDIHWGVIEALYAAADAFIEAEQETAAFHRKQQFCYREIPGTKSRVLPIDELLETGMTEDEAWHENQRERVRRYSDSGRIAEGAERRAAEVMAFRKSLSEFMVNGGAGLDDLLTVNVRAWLICGLQKIGEFEKWAKWERDEELARQEQRVMVRGFMHFDEQFAMYKAALLLRGIQDGSASEGAAAGNGEQAEQADEPAMKQRKPRGTKQLAIEFIKERITSRFEYKRLSEMKQGKNFKEIKVKLWNEFQEKETEKSKSITIETFHSYVRDALKEICSSRKQTSD